jgi:hypothetical protein
MPRFFNLLATVAAVATLSACNNPTAPAASSTASSLESASESAVAAEHKFETLAANSSQPGATAPRLTDPQAGPLLRKVFDTQALANAAAPPFDKIDPLQNWLLALTRVGTTYLLAGTGKTDLSSAASDMGLQRQVGQNMLTYGPEIGSYFDAQNAVLRLEVMSVRDHVAQVPADANSPGMAKVRGGVAQTIGGEIQTIGADGMTDDWRRARMPNLVALANASAPIMSPDLKAQLGAAARQAAGSAQDATVKSQMEALAATFGA